MHPDTKTLQEEKHEWEKVGEYQGGGIYVCKNCKAEYASTVARERGY